MRIVIYIYLIFTLCRCSIKNKTNTFVNLAPKWSNVFSLDICEGFEYHLNQYFFKDSEINSNHLLHKQIGIITIQNDSTLNLRPKSSNNCNQLVSFSVIKSGKTTDNIIRLIFPESALNKGLFVIHQDSIHKPQKRILDLIGDEDNNIVVLSGINCNRKVLDLELGYVYEVLSLKPNYSNFGGANHADCEINGFFKNEDIYLIINNLLIRFTKESLNDCMKYTEYERVVLLE